MIKNVVIAGLSVVALLLWMKVDPECVNTDDPNTVTIEYQCADLSDYENVPPEVVEECTKRAEEATNHKPKT